MLFLCQSRVNFPQSETLTTISRLIPLVGKLPLHQFALIQVALIPNILSNRAAISNDEILASYVLYVYATYASGYMRSPLDMPGV